MVGPCGLLCTAVANTNHIDVFAVGPAPAELEPVPHDAAQGTSAVALHLAVWHHVE